MARGGDGVASGGGWAVVNGEGAGRGEKLATLAGFWLHQAVWPSRFFVNFFVIAD